MIGEDSVGSLKKYLFDKAKPKNKRIMAAFATDKKFSRPTRACILCWRGDLNFSIYGLLRRCAPRMTCTIIRRKDFLFPKQVIKLIISASRRTNIPEYSSYIAWNSSMMFLPYIYNNCMKGNRFKWFNNYIYCA